MHSGQGELKYSAARFIRLCPQPAPMGVDDRPADRQPHPHSAGLRGVESLENALEMSGSMPGPESHTATRTPTVWVCSVLINNSRGSCLNRAHGFDCVQDQVQDDLLQLNTIALEREAIPPLRRVLTETPFLVIALPAQYNHLVDRLVKIKTPFSRRRFLDVITDPVDDISGSIGIAHDTAERFPDFAQIRRLLVQKNQGRTGVVARAGDRLRDFVSQRSSQLSHHAHAIQVARSASSRRSLSSALLRSVKSTTKATPRFPSSSKRRHADQHRNTAAVFPEVLLLKWL